MTLDLAELERQLAAGWDSFSYSRKELAEIIAALNAETERAEKAEGELSASTVQLNTMREVSDRLLAESAAKRLVAESRLAEREKEIERLVEALLPFAKGARTYLSLAETGKVRFENSLWFINLKMVESDPRGGRITGADLERAASLLTPTPDPAPGDKGAKPPTISDLVGALEPMAGHYAGWISDPRIQDKFSVSLADCEVAFKLMTQATRAGIEPTYAEGYPQIERATPSPASQGPAQEAGRYTAEQKAREREIADAAGKFAVELCLSERDPNWSHAEMAATIAMFITDRLDRLTANSPPARGAAADLLKATWDWRDKFVEYRDEPGVKNSLEAFFRGWDDRGKAFEPLIASALAAEYERGARDMRERAALGADTRVRVLAEQIEENNRYGTAGSIEVSDVNEACEISMRTARLLAEGIRALPLTPEKSAGQ